MIQAIVPSGFTKGKVTVKTRNGNNGTEWAVA
jgi:hypothetical protein